MTKFFRYQKSQTRKFSSHATSPFFKKHFEHQRHNLSSPKRFYRINLAPSQIQDPKTAASKSNFLQFNLLCATKPTFWIGVSTLAQPKTQSFARTLKKKPFCANPAPSPQRNGAQKRALQITTGVQEGLRFPCRHFLAGVHGRHCNH
ncbi:hypothetical protein CDAR_91011 [Caerostris darwini]|uniref:Uncharacterized protein n=1 Tax=Caerostris darwini TaxID=1538125 RepID=A0AAV4QB88_9ARAC|nr:hypothetical protein CDAR_91011 [Caerostris darwini]